MGLFVNPLSALVERAARKVGDWRNGTISGSPTTAQIIDTSRTESDDFFQNTSPVSRARIYSTTDGAAPQDEERTLTDWVLSTGTGTVSPVFSVAPGAGDKYCILSEYTWDEIVDAINESIDAAGNLAFVDKIDTTITPVSGIYEYPIPAGFIFIYRITVATSAGDFGNQVDPNAYKIIRAGTPLIHFFTKDSWGGDMLDSLSAYPLRIEGYVKQERLVKVTDVCYIDPVYVVNYAAALLHAKRIRRADNEPDEHRTQFQVCKALADANKPRLPLTPNLKRVA